MEYPISSIPPPSLPHNLTTRRSPTNFIIKGLCIFHLLLLFLILSSPRIHQALHIINYPFRSTLIHIKPKQDQRSIEGEFYEEENPGENSVEDVIEYFERDEEDE